MNLWGNIAADKSAWIKAWTKNSNTGKKRYFTYVTVPEHVTTELIKLHGIQFNSKCIIVEEAKNKLPDFSEAKYLDQYHQFLVTI